jgi:hypothetical protein
MEPTWATRELPLLDAIVRHFDGDDPFAQGIPEVKTFADITGLNAREVLRAVRALSPSYVTTQDIQSDRPMIMGVTDAARQAVGQWPSPESVTDRIVRELVAAAEREPDEAKRTKLRAAAETVGGFARDVVVSVIANVATKPIGF